MLNHCFKNLLCLYLVATSYLRIYDLHYVRKHIHSPTYFMKIYFSYEYQLLFIGLKRFVYHVSL
jgi:hypothetical protein